MQLPATTLLLLMTLPALTVAAGAPQSAMVVTAAGTQPSSTGPAANFTGAVRVDPLFAAKPTLPASGAYVTFAPGARSAWHSHPLGQMLVVTAGEGRVQSWGGPVQIIKPGDVVWTPPNVKHWHGAAPASAMTHMAIQQSAAGSAVSWMEQVTDAQYQAPARANLPQG